MILDRDHIKEGRYKPMYDVIENKEELEEALKTLSSKIVSAFLWKTDKAPGIVPGSRSLDIDGMISDFSKIVTKANNNIK